MHKSLPESFKYFFQALISDMNPVIAFVHRQFERPNIPLAMVFFLSPYVAYFIPAVLLGRQLIVENVAITLGKGLLVWVVATILLYVLLFAFKGKEVKGNVVSLGTSFSLNYFIITVATILSVLIFVFTFSGFYTKMYENKDTITNMAQVKDLLNSTAPSELVILFSTIAIFILLISMFLLSFSLIYGIGNTVKKTSIFSNTVFTVVYFAVLFSVMVILQL